MSSVIFVQKKPENRDSGQRPNRQGIKYAIICLLLAVALVIAIDGRQPCFYMTGGQEIETAYREPFEDPGIVAVLSGRLFGDGKRQLKVKTDGTVIAAGWNGSGQCEVSGWHDIAAIAVMHLGVDHVLIVNVTWLKTLLLGKPDLLLVFLLEKVYDGVNESDHGCAYIGCTSVKQEF